MPMENDDAAFGSRAGRLVRCFGGVAWRSDPSDNGNMSVFLTWVQTAVSSLQRRSLTGISQLLLAVQLLAGGGRCGAAAVCPEMQPVCSQRRAGWWHASRGAKRNLSAPRFFYFLWFFTWNTETSLNSKMWQLPLCFQQLFLFLNTQLHTYYTLFVLITHFLSTLHKYFHFFHISIEA